MWLEGLKRAYRAYNSKLNFEMVLRALARTTAYKRNERNIMLQNELLEMLHYDLAIGAFYIKKNNKVVRRIFPNEDGYLIFYRSGKRLKLKANRIAMQIITNETISDKYTILHKNLDDNDYRLQNLKVISRVTYNNIKEAHRNLSGALRLQPHSSDVFSYVLNWKENGKDRVQVIHDIVIAKRLYNRLQLKYAKILSKYCVFD